MWQRVGSRGQMLTLLGLAWLGLTWLGLTWQRVGDKRGQMLLHHHHVNASEIRISDYRHEPLTWT